MGTKIHILDDNVVSKIAAGEVVERPASVVKELVENSIDAASSSIHIEIQDAGSILIRIADNGDGMSKEDAKLCCHRHSTSKLKDISDLGRISTMGFRGEALGSIASVSQMDITTYDGTEESGVHLYIEGGEIQKIHPAARTKGTTVEVRNIFYNVPARRKFLRKESTELAMIIKTVGRFIMLNEDVEFVLVHDGKEMMRATGEMSLMERMKLVMGADIGGGMINIAYGEGALGVRGYISAPSFTRKDKESQVFFVNKRYVQSKVISDAVYDGYKSLLERGRYPSAVLFVSVDPEDMDVNVHPTKLLVKFDNEKDIREMIIKAIKDTFDKVKKTGPVAGPGFTFNTQSVVRSEILGTRQPEIQPELVLEEREDRYVAPAIQPGESGFESFLAPGGQKMFQFGDLYIIEMKGDRITVTDQHAAHERILYEYFSKAVRENTREVQNLLFPVRLDLSASEAVLMEKLLDKFRMLGFNISPFGKNSYVIESTPAILKDRDVKTVIYDVLNEIASSDSPKADPLEEMIKMTSCRSAIKAGEKLDGREMLSLLDKLAHCELPFTCPHGRPTQFDITVDELEKRFRRK